MMGKSAETTSIGAPPRNIRLVRAKPQSRFTQEISFAVAAKGVNTRVSLSDRYFLSKRLHLGQNAGFMQKSGNERGERLAMCCYQTDRVLCVRLDDRNHSDFIVKPE